MNTVFQKLRTFPPHDRVRKCGLWLRMQKTPAAEITPPRDGSPADGAAGNLCSTQTASALCGQQQRVAIARAVVNKPRLLLLDESLSALDYKLRKQMQNELKALQRKLGITFVFVTADQERSTHHVGQDCVRDGRIGADGTPREIYEEKLVCCRLHWRNQYV